MMEKTVDVFAWTQKLECPSTICNDTVKKKLRSGLVGLLFDNLENIIFPAEEVKTLRKNILLYQLRQRTPSKVVQCMQNISQLKLDEADLNNQISKLEEEYERLDFTVRQKAQRLRDTSSKCSKAKARVDLLKLKQDQTTTQLRDSNNMRLVCQHLMPSTCKDLNPKMLQEMLSVVTSLWNGANKREVRDTIINNLDNVEVPTLWHHVYQNLKNFDELMKTEAANAEDTDKKNMNGEIAKLHGKHIFMVLKQLKCSAASDSHQKNILEFIQKIETASNNCNDVSEWLVLALEVKKLEMEQIHLQKEIDKIREDIHENAAFAFDIGELHSEIQYMDTEITEYVQDIQQSLSILKSMPLFITKIKEKMCVELQKIKALRNHSYDSSWLNNNLTTELDAFHDTLDLGALRKIMLKGDIGIYRYKESCFSEASVSVTNLQASNIMSYFPMIQTPVYSLIECCKNLMLSFIYKKFESLETEENSDVFQMPVVTCTENNDNIIELLNSSKAINVKTTTEIQEFHEMFNAWIHQTVQKVMKIIDKTVDDATFPEWLERYSLMLYMLQNSK